MIAIALPQHDIGVREVAALSARASYVFMCLTLCWGVLTATGWIKRLTGHQAIRSAHMIFATFTLATGISHAIVFLLLREQGLDVVGIAVPFSGTARHALGILGLELMVAITITTGMRRFIRYRNWLRFHQLAYIAVGMVVVHSWFGAIHNGHLALLWLGGITVLTPAVTLTALRFLPPKMLIRAGLLAAAPATTGTQLAVVEPPPPGPRVGRKVQVSVDNQRCKRYGICQAESPQLFQLMEDGRLRYVRDPDTDSRAQAQAAARSCPMQAIQLQEVRTR
ncbi:ferric reductase-like transmembrane domain-containing protein [Actinophytocola algeriensis]|uniref:Sulfoxide reductase heme-binding subunit YedZ n=1 Tax=Actinophytocola algeriensis TaxID=1768010 RepID=A0A7W7Q1A3_9PSEU|nr:ferric reductase-like transmembrane domain-containing protein [Actinophytocola algeriensis]MBB4905006.1 sulfoxide reductase heme-binding subunit YedZ [Actinophytocola algeriensis]MBE1476134.1 sulfoxide reductase heme-binding subunit YedZ [Actinophytocola algeriensis]